MPAYPLSFTAASLRPRESQLLAARYRELGDWEAVYRAVAKDPLFGSRKEASIRRTLKELALRLDTLTGPELALLAEGEVATQRLLCWQGVCRVYPFIGRFVAEVVYPKVQRLDYRLLESDYRGYLREESDRHPRLLELTDSTLEKLRSQLFLFMEEAGLLDREADFTLCIPSVSEHLRTCVPAPSLRYWLLTETAPLCVRS